MLSKMVSITVGASPIVGSSSRMRVGLVTMAIPKLSICRWPPLRVRALLRSFSFRMGNRPNTPSRERRRSSASATVQAPRWRCSLTVIWGKMLLPWGQYETPCRMIRCGSIPVMSSPSRTTFPSVGFRYPRMVSSTVDLPAPFGPMRAIVSPRPTSSETPCRISFLP